MRFSSMNYKNIGRVILLCTSFLLFLQCPASAQEKLGAIAPATPAKAAAIVPDAQIEAEVLKDLAGAPELTNQNVTTTTVYGVVIISGSVPDEATRLLTETVVSRASGVKKVVDELTLAPAEAAGNIATTQPQDSNMAGGNANPPPQNATSSYPQAQQSSQSQQSPQPDPQSAPTPTLSCRAPIDRQPYPQGPDGLPHARYPQNQQAGDFYGAQQGGQPVVVPSGTMLRVRINQGLDSKYVQVGSTFDGVVLNDVVADGAVAIPRGATIQGTVVQVKASGALKGRGELSLHLTQVVLGGRVFPLMTDQWSSVGPDKTGHTVGSAIGLGAMGALIGAVAGGGPGAALGAGVGAGAGMGVSAASGGGQALIPPEAILTFHLIQPSRLTTVSQAEMDRLGYGVPVGSQMRLVRRPQPIFYGPYDGYPERGYPVPYPASYPYPY